MINVRIQFRSLLRTVFFSLQLKDFPVTAIAQVVKDAEYRAFLLKINKPQTTEARKLVCMIN